MQFRDWLYERSGEGSGQMTLYHFVTSVDRQNPPENITLDPNQFGKNAFTLNDKKASGIPRVFFYVDIKEKERYFRSATLYKVVVPSNEIYNVLDDHLGIKAKLRAENNGALAIGPLLSAIKDAGYKGIYYNPGIQIVNYFYPIQVQLAHEETELKSFQLTSI